MRAATLRQRGLRNFRGGNAMRADDPLLSLMRSVDTPTICNALELVAGRRLGEGYTRKPVVSARPALPPIVGYAKPATIACSSTPREPADVLNARRLSYYEYIAAEP